MSAPTIPTPQDAALLLQDAVTKTANFNTAAFDLGAGFAPGGLGRPVAAIVHVTAGPDTEDGDETYGVVLQESSDNATFSPAGPAVSVAGGGAVAVPGRLTRRFVRLALVVGGATPSITFKAWLNPLP